jgi:hypothetical protein
MRIYPLLLLLLSLMTLPAWAATPKLETGKPLHPPVLQSLGLERLTSLSEVSRPRREEASEFHVRPMGIAYRKHREGSQTQPSVQDRIYRPITPLPGSGHDYLKAYTTSH